jgi:hypothetical protein
MRRDVIGVLTTSSSSTDDERANVGASVFHSAAVSGSAARENDCTTTTDGVSSLRLHSCLPPPPPKLSSPKPSSGRVAHFSSTNFVRLCRASRRKEYIIDATTNSHAVCVRFWTHCRTRRWFTSARVFRTRVALVLCCVKVDKASSIYEGRIDIETSTVCVTKVSQCSH